MNDKGYAMDDEGQTVAVVGSGAAGTAAAFRLQQAGYRVRVFEANDYIGGRSTHLQRDGFTIDQGPTILWSNYESVLGIAADAGLGDELIPGGAGFGFSRGPDEVYSIDTSRLLRDAVRFPLSNRSRLAALKLGLDCLRLKGRLNYDDLSAVVDYDTESAEAYGQRRLTEELLQYMVRPAVRCLVAAPADTVSKVDLLFSVVRFMGIGTKWLAFRDGMGSYPQRVHQRFATTLNAQVTSVEEAGDEVQLSWTGPGHDERTDRFAGCVIAVPAPVAAGLHAQLDPWRRQFLEQVRYAAMQSVGLALSRPPQDIPATLLCLPPDADIFATIFEHNKAPGRVPTGKGLVNVYTPDKLARELMDQHDDVVVDRVIEATEKVLPRMSADLEFATVRRWEYGVINARVGHYRDLARFREIRATDDRRIQIAGDYFAPSSMNTASASGEHAARALVGCLTGADRFGAVAA